MPTRSTDPAFSRPAISDPQGKPVLSTAQVGLTKREYFAAHALEGLLARGEPIGTASLMARDAADRLIEDLARAPVVAR